MITILLFILGAIAGSFMNVCIWRLPRKESLVRPRSRCPSCGGAIAWYDNIPILSFLILKARCRLCKNKISAVYPIVELLSGAVAVLLYAHFGLSAKFFSLWYLFGALTVVSFIDLRFREIPDEITLSGIALGLIAGPPHFLDSLLGVIAGGGSIYLLGLLGEFIFKKEAMGGGDIKLLAMIGAFLGWKMAFITFFLAPLFGSIVGITLKIRKGAEIIPYGPHLSLAAFVAALYGEEILNRLFF